MAADRPMIMGLGIEWALHKLLSTASTRGSSPGLAIAADREAPATAGRKRANEWQWRLSIERRGPARASRWRNRLSSKISRSPLYALFVEGRAPVRRLRGARSANHR